MSLKAKGLPSPCGTHRGPFEVGGFCATAPSKRSNFRRGNTPAQSRQEWPCARSAARYFRLRTNSSGWASGRGRSFTSKWRRRLVAFIRSGRHAADVGPRRDDRGPRAGPMGITKRKGMRGGEKSGIVPPQLSEILRPRPLLEAVHRLTSRGSGTLEASVLSGQVLQPPLTPARHTQPFRHPVESCVLATLSTTSVAAS